MHCCESAKKSFFFYTFCIYQCIFFFKFNCQSLYNTTFMYHMSYFHLNVLLLHLQCHLVVKYYVIFHLVESYPLKNSAYWRHWISPPMRIVAPIPFFFLGDLRANKRPRKKLHLISQKHISTHRHGNFMTKKAQWGWFSKEFQLDSASLASIFCFQLLLQFSCH